MAQKIVRKFIKPIEEFLQFEAAGGIILIVMTVIAMVWANSPWHHSYHEMLHTHVKFGFGDFLLDKTLHHWVNDGLMVIFFFVVGLEIKAEMLNGELSTPKKAALPMFAALGGMIAPALIYTFINAGEGGDPNGWAIPMATDIAFAVGVISLLGKRVPLSLKIFLLALAIVDDLGAVLVIAFFYTSEISGSSLGFAAIAMALTVFSQKVGIRAVWVYLVLGICVWLGILQSGVHATIAGVLIGFLTPAIPFLKPKEFGDKLVELTDGLKKSMGYDLSEFQREKMQDTLVPEDDLIYELQEVMFESVSPLERIIHYMHPWVAYFIMPVFALFNAGVELGGVDLSHAISPVSLGVVAGLVIGKPLGIFIFCWVTVKFGLANLPEGTSWKQIIGVGFLAGIGFTMALFICNLSMAGTEKESFAKLAILVASVIASVLGSFILYNFSGKKQT